MIVLDGLDRRSLMQRALLLVGATALPGAGAVLAAPRPAATRFLSPARFALLSAVADTIVPATDTPGALVAGVPAAVDAMLRDWASPERQKDLVAALDAIDALAVKGGAAGFAALAPEARFALLKTHDVAALKPLPSAGHAAGALKASPAVVDPNYGRLRQDPAPGKPADAAPSPADPAKPQRKASITANPLMAEAAVADPAYSKLKELIVVLFYFSETALTHDLPYEHAPGAWVPSMPVTPATRSYGGPALT